MDEEYAKTVLTRVRKTIPSDAAKLALEYVRDLYITGSSPADKLALKIVEAAIAKQRE